jgi:hypothetical protein
VVAAGLRWTRTWHRLAVAVEDAGFEVHDSIAWLHGQGFPKHKGHLKPAFEPVVRGRKKGTRPSWLNIDACRIGTSKAVPSSPSTPRAEVYGFGANEAQADRSGMNPNIGRWPTNVLLDGSQADALDEQSGQQRDGVAVNRNRDERKPSTTGYGTRASQPLAGLTPPMSATAGRAALPGSSRRSDMRPRRTAHSAPASTAWPTPPSSRLTSCAGWCDW